MLWKQLRDAAGTFFNLGVGGAGLRSQSSRVEVRNAANNGFAPLVADQLRLGATDSPWFKKFPGLDAIQMFAGASDGSSVIADGSLNVGAIAAFNSVLTPKLSLYYGISYSSSRALSIGGTPPSSPQVGDRWIEINESTGASLYGWWWEWSGVYWLSPEMRRSILFDNAAAITRLYFECDQTLDYFFTRLLTGILVQTTNSGSAYWTATLERLNAANTATSIGSALTTQSLAADTNHALSNTIGTHVDVSAVSARQFRVNLSRVSTPGSAFGSATVVFNYARP